jgi:hypothetical protein
MHFLGASRDGLVARPVEMDKLFSSVRDRLDQYKKMIVKNKF